MTPDEHVNEELILNPDIISKAQTGDHSAQLGIGRAYYQATHIENNCHNAFKWIKVSAEQGNAESQFLLADMFALGHGVDQDILVAHEWYTKSALQDYPKALIRVHNLYHEDKKIHCSGELSSEEEGMNEPKFKKNNGVRELYEYRLKTMQATNLLGNTMDFFSTQFRDLTESKDKDADTMCKLGFHYHHGYGVREIPKRAIECYTLAAENGHTNAQYNLGCLYQENTEIKFNYRHAFKWFKLAAEAGHSAAQNCLAYFFEKGIVVEMDFSEALLWYSRSAVNNNKGAMVNIARMYRKGLVGNQPNYSRSIEWYKKAAQLGSSAAKNCLYQLSQRNDTADGHYNTENDLLQVELSAKDRLCSKLRVDVSAMSDDPNVSQLEKLASHALVGDGNAMLKIGIKYFNGSNLAQDKETGLKWIQNSAKSGLLKAQLLVGKLYENGRTDVVKQDYHKAVICYSQAAKQKNDVAQHKIGLLYYHGHGLRKDPLEASRWFTWSANQNNSDAQCMLGLLRTTGEGLRKDDFEAYQWFTKSGSQRNLQALYHLGVIERRGTTFFKDGIIKIGETIEVNPKKNIKRALSFFEYAANHGCLDAQLLFARIHDEGYRRHHDSNEAFIYYMQAAKQGNTEAIYKVGYMYLEGRGTKQDYIKAYRYITKAAEKNHAGAKSLLVAPIKETIENIDYSKVLKMFEVVTLNDLASLEYNIGCFYEYGFGDHNSRRIIEKDFFNALKWYWLAGKKNHAEANYKLGTLHQLGKIPATKNLPQSHFYEKGASLNHPDSLYALGTQSLQGKGSLEDMRKTFNLFFEAANLGHPVSRSVLSLLYDTKAFIEDSRIIIMMEEVGSNGNTIVQYRLGCYYESSGDIKRAIKWYELAAQGRLTDAYYRLGRIYETQEFQDFSKAIELYEAAFDNFHDEAAYRVAQMYHYGTGVSQNYSKAFRLYTKAANLGNWSATRVLNIAQVFKGNCVDITNDTEVSDTSTNGNKHLNLTSKELKKLLLMHEYIAKRGDADHQYNVGYIYETGSESPDYPKAFKWYSMAASSSHKDAIYRLGLLYSNGDGVTQNWNLATEKFKKAMDLGSVDACYQLGSMYSSGKVEDIDYSKAEQYYIMAADKGHCDAQFSMGKLYEDGDVEGKCFLDALKWYTKAYFQENNLAIAHLYTLDGEEDFEKELYSKLFKRMDRYKGHQYGKFTEDDVLKLERHYGQVADNITQFYGYVYYQLGYMYFNGNGTDVNYKKAWCHFNKSHKVFHSNQALYFMNIDPKDLEKPVFLKKILMFNAGSTLNAEQSYHLGSAIYNENRFKQTHGASIFNRDDEFAFGLLERSAKEGYLKSKKLLADMYCFGYGVAADYKKSLQCHIGCASEQDGNENFQIGREYYDSNKDDTRGLIIALGYIIKAVNQKNVNAQSFLYDRFYPNQDTTTFIKKEREVHKALADQQNSNENLNVAYMYYYGIGNTKIKPSTGFIYLQRAADQKNPVAQRILGDMHYYGNMVNENHEKGKELHKSSASQLSGRECSRVGQSYYTGSKHFTKNHEIAFIYLTESIAKGNYDARRYLGDIYFSGDAVEENKEKALQLHENFAINLSNRDLSSIGQTYYVKEWYSIAAIYLKKTKDNDPTALRYLGNMYYEGKGVEKNYEKALWFYQMSASRLVKEESYRIGLEYFNASNQSKNIEAGLVYINGAIKQRYSTATKFLAEKYYYGGGGLDKDQVKALELHEMLADRNDGSQNFMKGKEYCEGSDNLKKNTTIGLVYLNKAAFDQDSSATLRYLGDLFYYGGDDLDMDQVKALEIHTSLADRNDGSQNFDIGKAYYEGSDNLKKNITIGLVYLNKAVLKHYPKALRYMGDLFYYGGDGIDMDQVKALELHELSADRNDGSQNFMKGKEYCEGSDNLKKNTTIGLVYLNKAAFDQDSSIALLYMGDLFYYGGDDLDMNQVKALEIHTSLADSRKGSQNFIKGKQYCEGSDNLKKNTTIGLVYLNKAAFDQDSSTALRYLGDLFYYGGDDLDMDQVKAVELHELSADHNIGSKNFDIGKAYYEGSDNLKKNITIGLVYLNKAAFGRHQDCSEALQYMGDLLYYGGDGISKDEVKALELHELSADHNIGSQNFDIGKAYYEGSDNLKKNAAIGLVYLNKAVLKHYPKALRYMGDLFYYGGDGIDTDQIKALKLYKMSVDRNSGSQNFMIGKAYCEGSENLKKNITIGLVYLNKAAFGRHQDCSEALQYMGDLLYYGGDGISKDQVKALELHKSSADRENGYRNFDIGKAYYEGSDNLKKNTTIGLVYLNKAVLKHYPKALRYMGDLFYYGGDGIDMDQVKALELHELSADRNDGSKNFDIGKAYYEGSDNLKKNSTIGLVYLNKAAFGRHQDCSEALQYMGDLLYYGGDGISKDEVKVLELHELSADHNIGSQNFDIGKAYYEGSDNLKKNITIGLVYLNKAVLKHYPKALRYMGDLFYYGGDGIDMDQVKALELHELSADRNDGSQNFMKGKEYCEGSDNLKKNTKIGLVYLNKAAFGHHQDCSEALQYMGDLLYYGGDDLDMDQVKAVELHELSADHNIGSQNFMIGKAYYKGSDNLKKNITVGLVYLNKAAFDRHQDCSEALQYMGDLLYYGGDGISKDQVKALELHKSIADRNVRVQNLYKGKEYCEGSDSLKKNAIIGLVYLNKAAFDQDSSIALLYMGDLFYYGGDDLDMNQVKALEIHTSLADSRKGSQNFIKGKQYCEGSDNLKKNTTIGLVYLNKAAFDQDSSTALRYLGDLFYYGGDDLDMDQVKAVELHELSADHNIGSKNFDIGKAYYEGSDNLKKNTTIGLVYLNKALNQNYHRARSYLDDTYYEMYYFGESYQKELKAALDSIMELEKKT